ncbi:putative transporter [Colletotrichum gloeosporioides]|uniref:Putative transporter n=1 Tax=Colletotrichum gloeosporioides TaxID=474922 RepID=A0A8H4CLT9_COLGL|nr:putative transporter [Colletotrichum gloeosporioides]KAF3806259.1 putative transporter [Colletotrichum gloeosporioides]
MSRTQEISELSVDETLSSHLKFRTAIRGEEISNAFGADEEISRETALTALTAAEERKLIRRVDWRLIPLLSMLYLMKKIDENNASNARIMNKGTSENILTQLGITSDQFGMITILYTVGDVLVKGGQLLTQANVGEIGPLHFSRDSVKPGLEENQSFPVAVKNYDNLTNSHFLLSGEANDVISDCQGPYHGLHLSSDQPRRTLHRAFLTWTGELNETRKLKYLCSCLSMFQAEAGMFPAIILQLTYWYRPDEIAVRLVWIFTVGNVAGIIGGILAYAFHLVSGAYDISGWQWLFIVEGALTIVLAFVVWFFLPDFPATTKWLSPTEKAFLQARLPQNSPRAVERNFVFKEILTTLRDKRLWLFTLSWALMTTGSSGVKFYQPTIISNMGFSGIATAQILNIPMSVVTIALLLGSGWASNKARIPVPLFPISSCVITVACYSVLVAYPHDIGVYIAMIIGNAFSIAWFPMMWSWRSQTVNGATGSAFAIGFVNSYGQIGDAIGPQMFQDVYEPRYQLPFGLAMGLVSLCGVTNGYTWWVTRQTERDTRRHKLARLQAKLQNQAVLDDVTDNDLKRDAA